MNVLFFGKDDRYDVLIDHLSKNNNVECIGYRNRKVGNISNLSKYDMIILPMYGIKNNKIDNIEITDNMINSIKDDCIIYTGIIPEQLKDKRVISFMEDEQIKKENDLITVDGIMEHIKKLNKSSICILGYGHIGKLLYERLKKDYFTIVGVRNHSSFENNSGIYFLTSNQKHLKINLENSSLIINTVPDNIITEDLCPNIKGYILDIASYPYGIDLNLVSKYHLNYYLYSSIPSKYDPKRAGKVLLKKF